MLKRIPVALYLLLASIVPGLPASAQTNDDGAAGIRRVEGRVDEPVFLVSGLESSLKADEVDAFAGNQPLAIKTVAFAPRPPTDFLVLIDVSHSTKAKADIQQVMDILIQRMGNNDRMEIATFGDMPFQRLTPLTSRTAELRQAVGMIEATDSCTKLYQALISAARRLQDPSPAPAKTGRNAVLVVLSDGKDDDPDQSSAPRKKGEGVCNPGKDTSFLKAHNDISTADASLLFIDTAPDRNTLCKSDLATRIASRSDKPDRRGGLCTRLDGAADAISTLTAVTRIETACDDCPDAPQIYTLDTNTSRGSLHLTREAKLDPPAPNPDPDKNVTATIPVEPPPITDQPWFLPLVIGLVVLVGLIIFWVIKRSRPQKGIGGDNLGKDNLGKDNVGEDNSGNGHITPPQHQTLAQPIRQQPNAEFTQIGHSGSEKRFPVLIVERPISLGQASSCYITLSGDPSVADIQCEFCRNNGDVLVRNIASNAPMLLDGVEVPAEAGWRLLRHGDVLRVGSTELRYSNLERTL